MTLASPGWSSSSTARSWARACPRRQAGPFELSWNTTTYATGAHTLTTRAYDAAGNTATSAAVTVTVDQNSVRFTERFSGASGPDNAGWSLSEWALDASDQTGMTGSKSILGSATPAFNTVTRTASVSVALHRQPTADLLAQAGHVRRQHLRLGRLPRHRQ